MSDLALELVDVTKRFGSFAAVNALSFALPRGRILGYLGPNGAGKTTSIRMMLGILKPDEGAVRILGGEATGQRGRIGYLPEERGLYKRMRADESIAYIASLKGVPRRDALAKARAFLDRYGLGKFARTRIEGLSKGMAQKVQLISAIVHDPEFIILDEPFSGLDPVNQSEVEQTIRELTQSGMTILFSTHTMQHAERLADQLIVISRGRKLFDGDLNAARGLLPRRARIGADADLSFLKQSPQVTAIAQDGENWTLDLKEGADGRDLLAQIFERRVPLTHFDVAPPSLHDVFVSLIERDRAAA
ncbi:MAG TPA: ATP-binding cassette domain-containing protein [Rhizomicrobium sp.]